MERPAVTWEGILYRSANVAEEVLDGVADRLHVGCTPTIAGLGEAETGKRMGGRVGTGSRTMADLIGLAAARHGGKPALKHKLGGEWVDVSYQQLDRTVRELALGLVDLGIEPGDRVSILSHTRPEWTYACFATFAAGAIVVSIYQTNSAEECHYVLHHSGARAVFVEDAEQLAKVRAVEADLPALEFVIVIEPADADGSTISLDALRERGRGRLADRA